MKFIVDSMIVSLILEKGDDTLTDSGRTEEIENKFPDFMIDDMDDNQVWLSKRKRNETSSDKLDRIRELIEEIDEEENNQEDYFEENVRIILRKPKRKE